MHRTFLSLLVYLLSYHAKSQHKFVVVDSMTSESIENAFVYLKSKGFITIIAASDPQGAIRTFAAAERDSVTFSHVSYLPKTIEFASLRRSDTVRLVRKYSILEAVTINNFKPTGRKTFGYYHGKGQRVLSTQTPGWLIGTIIDIDTTVKRYKISKLLGEFRKSNSNKGKKESCKVGLVFYFFEVINGKPTANELMDPLIVPFDELKSNLSVALNNSPSISNSSGQIFIGIEWQSLPCLDAAEPLNQYYLRTIWSDSDLKVWNYNKHNGRWSQSRNSLTSGKGCISIQIDFK